MTEQVDNEKLADELMESFFQLGRGFAKIFKGQPFTHQQMAILKTIKKHADDPQQGIKASDISRRLGVAQPSIASMLNFLEKEDYIVRNADAGDRRVVLIGLTPRGEGFLKEHMRKIQERYSEMISVLGTEDSRKLIKLLQKANAYFNKQ